jgi:hypothetical protein
MTYLAIMEVYAMILTMATTVTAIQLVILGPLVKTMSVYIMILVRMEVHAPSILEVAILVNVWMDTVAQTAIVKNLILQKLPLLINLLLGMNG